MYTINGGGERNAIDLSKEYSPTKNSKRFLEAEEPDKAVIEHFLKVTTEQTESALAKYKVRRDVSYGKSFKSNKNSTVDNRIVDIYYKDTENGTPIFVYIHGGYWQELDRSTSGSFVEPLVEQDFRVIAVDYNLCPSVSLATLNEQFKHFFEWLYAYASDTKASKISISGHSAGAYMMTLLFNNSLLRLPFVDNTVSFFLISGVFDLRELWNLPSVNPANILNLDLVSAEELSPICWKLDEEFIELAKQIQIRIHVLVAENDSETFKGQSLAFTKKLRETGLEIEFKLFEGYDHFDIIENVPVKGSEINTYLLKHLV
ncbi:PREDICTED: kynurenine formamidase [Bactrocera latifrons]|uniref:kynurenine formamidase n=1 Tax=Bactrocera latifrons TaxID=174628 RepID=UPI0008DCF3F7|nr:PREDICTED: kynurenine formamidase [Bactrocera latifrons]